MYLDSQKKKEIFAEHGGETNTGSPEGQIALFTYRAHSHSNPARKAFRRPVQVGATVVQSEAEAADRPPTMTTTTVISPDLTALHWYLYTLIT